LKFIVKVLSKFYLSFASAGLKGPENEARVW
jgi:hypothetical protein